MFARLRKLPVVRTVFNTLLGGTAETQDAADMYNLAVLFKCYQWHNSAEQCSFKGKVTVDQIKSFEDLLQSGDFFDDVEYCQQMTGEQVMNLLRKLHVRQQQLSSSQRTNNDSDFQYKLSVRPSTISGAGNGVFVEASDPARASSNDWLVCPGTVLGFFPGAVYLNEFLLFPNHSYIQQNLLPDEHFMLLMRLDGVFIDSRKIEMNEILSRNPYAVAHMINHPTPSAASSSTPRLPNVVQYRYNFEQTTSLFPSTVPIPEELKPYVPHRYLELPRLHPYIQRSVYMPSSVVVASRYLKHGEELFVDYRLSPDAPQLPDWYEHVDAIGARSRITGKTLEQATAATSPSTGEPATRRRLF